MDRHDLASSIARASRLEGDFRLRSGARSTQYFDKYRFESDPALLRAIAEQLAPLIPSGVDALETVLPATLWPVPTYAEMLFKL